MTTVTVRHEFEKEGSVLLVDGPVAGEFDGALGGDDVHSVNLLKDDS